MTTNVGRIKRSAAPAIQATAFISVAGTSSLSLLGSGLRVCLAVRQGPDQRVSYIQLFAIVLSVVGILTPTALAEINVYPKTISLNHQQDFQRIIVQHTDELGVTTDITSEGKISTPENVKTDGTKIQPASDGETEIKIQVRGESITVPTAVRNAELDPPISFQREVIPALTKTGCNSGRCHGSALLEGKTDFNSHCSATTHWVTMSD